MQSYLGDYPGARSKPEFKFLRAVQSFVDQTHKDSELIIVSDGCQITHRLYFEHYKSNNRIKYAFISKDTPNMYESTDKTKIHNRGFPRQIGLEMATGDVIAYMDSDDFIMNHAAEYLSRIWETQCIGKYKLLLKNTWYVHESVDQSHVEPSFKVNPKDSVEIHNLPSRWVVVKPKEWNYVVESTMSISHVRDIDTKWIDIDRKIDGSEKSEDTIFTKSLIKEGETCIDGQMPYYVVCHSKNNWDY